MKHSAKEPWTTLSEIIFQMWWVCIMSSGMGCHIPDFLPHLILVRVDDKRHLA